MNCDICKDAGLIYYSKKWEAAYCSCIKGGIKFVLNVSILGRIGWMKLKL